MGPCGLTPPPDVSAEGGAFEHAGPKGQRQVVGSCGTNADHPRFREGDDAIDERKQGIISTTANVGPREKSGPPLADQNAAGGHDLSTIPLDPEVLRIGITPIAGGPHPFFTRHGPSPH